MFSCIYSNDIKEVDKEFQNKFRNEFEIDYDNVYELERQLCKEYRDINVRTFGLKTKEIDFLKGFKDENKYEIRDGIKPNMCNKENNKQKKIENNNIICPICCEIVKSDLLESTLCYHVFCKRCLEQVKKSIKPCCPICRSKL